MFIKNYITNKKVKDIRRCSISIDYVWGYSAFCGKIGGLIIAKTREEALAKLKGRYLLISEEDVILWQEKTSDYYDKNNPDVFDLFGPCNAIYD